MRINYLAGIALFLLTVGRPDCFASPAAWPGGSEAERIDITQADMGDNMSGAVWDSALLKLWVVSNSGIVWRMSCGSNCLSAAHWSTDLESSSPCRWAIGGDTEALAQRPGDGATLFVGVEQSGGTNYRLVQQYSVAAGCGQLAGAPPGVR